MGGHTDNTCSSAVPWLVQGITKGRGGLLCCCTPNGGVKPTCMWRVLALLTSARCALVCCSECFEARGGNFGLDEPPPEAELVRRPWPFFLGDWLARGRQMGRVGKLWLWNWLGASWQAVDWQFG